MLEFLDFLISRFFDRVIPAIVWCMLAVMTPYLMINYEIDEEGKLKKRNGG